MARRLFLFVLLVVLLVESVSAATANEGLLTLAAALATCMIGVQGLRYLISEDPRGRAEAKKGIIWTIMGLLIAYLAVNIVCALYCYALTAAYGSGVTCTSPCI